MAKLLNCDVEELIPEGVTDDANKLYYTQPEIFEHLSKDLQEFVLSAENAPYIKLAKQLKKL